MLWSLERLITSKVVVIQLSLLWRECPLLEAVVDVIEAEGVSRLMTLKLLLPIVVLGQLSLHLQKLVEAADELLYLALGKVGLVWLHAEVTIDHVLLNVKESSDLLKPGILLESLGELIALLVHWIVSHEILGQEDAGVESVLDALVNLSVTG